MKKYPCAKEFNNIFSGSTFYGDEPYCHEFVDNPGDDCGECTKVKERLYNENPST